MKDFKNELHYLEGYLRGRLVGKLSSNKFDIYSWILDVRESVAEENCFIVSIRFEHGITRTMFDNVGELRDWAFKQQDILSRLLEKVLIQNVNYYSCLLKSLQKKEELNEL